jgi:hypothetical protein
MDRMARGREATVASGIIQPMVEAAIESTLNMLCRAYKDGTLTHDILLGGIAEISALKGLLGHLERLHKQGIAARSTTHASS